MDATHLTVNVVVVIAMLAATWRTSAAATAVKLTADLFKTRLDAVTAALEEIPLMKQRIGHLENAHETMRKRVFSEYPKAHAELRQDVAVMKADLRHVSQHDIDERDE